MINNPLEINNFDIFKFSENEKCLNKFKNDEIKFLKQNTRYKLKIIIQIFQLPES